MMRHLTFVLCLVAAVGCAGLLNPAGVKLAEADRMAAAGEYEGAIAIYEEVESNWPDRPEATEARDKLNEALIGLVRERIATGNYVEAVPVYEKLVERKGSTPPDLQGAHSLGLAQKHGLEMEATLAFVFTAAEDAEGKVLDDTKAWTCENLSKIPAAKACIAADDDACSGIEPMDGWCEEQSLATAFGAWKARSRSEADAVLDEMAKLGNRCSYLERKTKAIEDKWAYAVLTRRRGAAVSMVLEQKPYNEQRSETVDEAHALRNKARASSWPKEMIEEVEATYRESSCR